MIRSSLALFPQRLHSCHRGGSRVTVVAAVSATRLLADSCRTTTRLHRDVHRRLLTWWVWLRFTAAISCLPCLLLLTELDDWKILRGYRAVETASLFTC